MTLETHDTHELFALAARLAGVTTVDLLKVRQDGDGLVVILITGQKYRFAPGQIADAIQNQLDNLAGAAAGIESAGAHAIDSLVRAQLSPATPKPTRKPVPKHPTR
ncbi:MAG: hypothetical protein ABI847_21845 [Anaerolineales bacterium]